ncbi:MAG: S4 domain-containing protein, partial [Thermodesulfobacteriota bacterium]
IPDDLMWRYYLLLTPRTGGEIDELKKGHPMDAKRALAFEITSWLHGSGGAKGAEEDFATKFSQREFPEDAREVVIKRDDAKTVIDLVVESSGKLKSRNEAKRLIAQGGVLIDGERVTDINSPMPDKGTHRMRIGKKEFVVVKLS